MWALKVSQANKRFLKKAFLRPVSKISKQALSSSSRLRMMRQYIDLNCLALSTLKSNKRFWFCPLCFCGWFERYIFFHSGINRHIPNHVRPNSSFAHCNYTIWWKVCFHGNPSCMHNIFDQLNRKVGRVLLRYCCSSSHRKVVLFMNFVSQTLLATNPTFNSSLSPHFSLQIDLALNMISLLEIHSIFKCSCYIQLRTSSSSSTSVSFLSWKLLSLRRGPTHKLFFDRLWISLLHYG